MMTKILIDEATVKLVLEALKQIDEAMPFPVAKLAQAALQEALAKPDFWEGYVPEPVKPAQQELVAKDNSNYRLDPPGLEPLYTTPQPAQRKPLTDEQMFEMAEIAWRRGWASCRDAEYVGEEAEDERWGMVSAEVVQDIAAHNIKENT